MMSELSNFAETPQQTIERLESRIKELETQAEAKDEWKARAKPYLLRMLDSGFCHYKTDIEALETLLEGGATMTREEIIKELETYLENAHTEVSKLSNWVIQLCVNQNFLQPIQAIVDKAKEEAHDE
jgi:predicted RNase H-like nuclease (RuvC/YqgF family)